MDFYGYMRPNGKAGARNYVLLLPVNRSLNFIASNVERMTRNTRHFEIPAETGRTEVDREVIARTLIGLMNNANVGGIVLLAVKSGAGWRLLQHAGRNASLDTRGSARSF